MATLSADLATMARRTGLDTLGYLLEMVRLEAESAIAATGRTASAERFGHGDFTPSFSQQRRGRIAVRHHAELVLLGADVVAQVEIDVALEVVHLVAERGELLLQGDARVARQADGRRPATRP